MLLHAFDRLVSVEVRERERERERERRERSIFKNCGVCVINIFTFEIYKELFRKRKKIISHLFLGTDVCQYEIIYKPKNFLTFHFNDPAIGNKEHPS